MVLSGVRHYCAPAIVPPLDQEFDNAARPSHRARGIQASSTYGNANVSTVLVAITVTYCLPFTW